MKARLAPFLVLLEARYAPLLFAVAPQAYAVYLWLFPQPYDGWGELFAVIGAIGFEAVYVGAIAWAEDGKAGLWTWFTAGAALIFSVAVAVYVYLPQSWWAALHAGFPVVAFCYTMQLHKMTAIRKVRNVPKQRRALVRKLVGIVRNLRTEVRTHAEAKAGFVESLTDIGDQLRTTEQESARLSDQVRMEEGKRAQAEEQSARLFAQLRTTQDEVRRLEEIVSNQSARLEASDIAGSLEVRTIAQALRDEGIPLRTIAAILGVSEKTIRNWTTDVRTNGQEVH